MKEIDRDLDLVLYAFMDTAPEPTDADVLEWQKRFPRYAKDILDHAVAARRCNAAAAESRADMDMAEAEDYAAGMTMGSAPSHATPSQMPRPSKTVTKEPDGQRPPRKPPGRTRDR